MADMFGAPVGFSQADQDMAKIAQVANTIRETNAQIPLYQAHTNLYNESALAKRQERETQAQLAAEMSRLLGPDAGGTEPEYITDPDTGDVTTKPGTGPRQGMSSDPMERMAHIVEQVGTAHIRAGKTVQGTAMLDKSAVIRRQIKQNMGTDVLAEHRRFQDTMKSSEWLLNGMDQVQDQAGLDRLNGIYEQTFKRPSPFAGMAATPETLKSMRGLAMSQYQRAQLAISEDRLGALEGEYESRERNRTRQRTETERRNREREDAARRKESGKDAPTISSPSNTEVDAARSFVKQELKDMPQDESERLSYKLAARARAIMRRNRGVQDSEQALQMALQEQQSSGAISLETNRFMRDDRPRYDPAKALTGRTPSLALPPEADINKRVDGRYYKLPNGSIGIWRGRGENRGWELPGTPGGGE